MVDAEKYGLASLSADRYNSKAMTNVGNVELMKGNINRARQVFSEAVTVDAECLEALFNNGKCVENVGWKLIVYSTSSPRKESK